MTAERQSHVTPHTGGHLKAEPQWLSGFRDAGRQRFDMLGFPTRKLEDWKYTNIGTISRGDFRPNTAKSTTPETLDAALVPGLDGPRMVFVNGVHDGASLADLPDGVTLMPLEQALIEKPDLLHDLLDPAGADSLRALNTAHLGQGLFLHVAAGAVLEEPIIIVHATDTTMKDRAAQLRHVVVLEDNARASVVEIFAGEADTPCWTNLVRGVRCGPGAVLDMAVLVDEGSKTIHTGHTDARVGTSSRFDQTAFILGGETVRHEVRVAVDGEGADVHLNGAYLAADGQSFTVFTEVDHCVPGSQSNQLFRGVLGAGSHAAFQGRVIVREGAQKTVADQSNHNLILDRSAEADTKPELEIYADDVKCSHGATVGELDDDMLFYLEARGIDPETARAILVEAFVGEVIEGVTNPALKDRVSTLVADWMSREGALPS